VSGASSGELVRFDDAADKVTFSSVLDASSVEFGGTTDTTITRSSAGVLAVEGVPLLSADATNVTAAGALMDNELASEADVKAFVAADYQRVEQVSPSLSGQFTSGAFTSLSPTIARVSVTGAWPIVSGMVEDMHSDLYKSADEFTWVFEYHRSPYITVDVTDLDNVGATTTATATTEFGHGLEVGESVIIDASDDNLTARLRSPPCRMPTRLRLIRATVAT